MFKRQRDITPPTSDDEEPRRRLVDYSDTESSDDEDNIRPPPRKRRPMVIYSDTESSDDEDDEDLTSYYSIKTVNEKKSRLFRAQGKEFQLNIKTFPDNVSHLQFISRLFDRLVEDIKERCQMESNDKMRMTILHPGLKLGVFVPWRDVSAMTGEAILQEIMKVQQSNENFRIHDGQMTIQITVVRLPVGSGRKPLHAGLYFESENMSINKRSIVQINNHRCADGCDGCYSDIPCIPGQKTRCMDCKRTFRSRDCFAKHKSIKSKQQKSICQLVYNCGKCNFRIVGSKKNHVCPGQRKCRNCKEIVGPNHQCYIQSYECKSEMTENEGEEEVSQPKKSRFIFFDFESNQETGTHQVNFCVAHKACDVSMGNFMQPSHPSAHL